MVSVGLRSPPCFLIESGTKKKRPFLEPSAIAFVMQPFQQSGFTTKLNQNSNEIDTDDVAAGAAASAATSCKNLVKPVVRSWATAEAAAPAAASAASVSISSEFLKDFAFKTQKAFFPFLYRVLLPSPCKGITYSFVDARFLLFCKDLRFFGL